MVSNWSDYTFVPEPTFGLALLSGGFLLIARERLRAPTK